jgi:hypothetical protein
MKTLCFVAIALIFSGVSSSAQQPTSVKISIFTFKYAEGHQEIFLNSRAGEYDAVKLSSANILGPFKTVLSEEGKVFLHENKKTEEGADIYPVIAEVKIPSSVREPLLILVPRSGDQAYGALVIDSSMTKFREGSYQLINFSRSEIRALIGKTRVTAPPMKITSFDPSSNSDDLLNVHFQYKLAEEWRTFGRTRWVNEKNKRSLLVAYMDPQTERMKIKGIPLRRTQTMNKQE